MKKSKLYHLITRIYSKYVPFFIVKFLKNKTAPAKIRYKFIKELAIKNNINIFIETGTYLGDTVNSLKNNFKKIYSFEISKELADKAKNRFKDYKNIEIVEGDSGEKLEDILKKIDEKTIFWLDGHYSEGFLHAKKYNIDTPIIKELKTIFESNIKNYNNIILIDDAFEFDGTRGYPTITNLKVLVENYTNKYDIYKKYNIIYIIPKN